MAWGSGAVGSGPRSGNNSLEILDKSPILSGLLCLYQCKKYLLSSKLFLY